MTRSTLIKSSLISIVLATSASVMADGEATYKEACAVCHAAGIAGSPKFGDKEAWAPRIATGKDALYEVALKGRGAMPPKGGRADLSDDVIKATVDYMVSQAK
jgi:cytochrome c5